MGMPPILFNGSPDVTGLYVRAKMVEMLYANDVDGLTHAARQWGNANVRYVNHRPNSWPPSMALIEVDGDWEMLITGTTNVQQVGLHLGGVLGVVQAAPAGILSGSWNLIGSLVWQEALNNGLGNASPGFLTITGHSYGAGVAGCLGFQAAARFSSGRTQILTFGCPRYRGGNIGAAAPGFNVRVVDEQDPVVLLPPQYASAALLSGAVAIVSKRSRLVPWRHVGYRAYLPIGGGIVNSGQDVEEPSSLVSWTTNPGIKAHTISEYARRLLSTGFVRWPNDSAEEETQGTPGWNQEQATTNDIPKSDGLVPDVANQVYFSTPTGPVSAENIDSWESTYLAIGTPTVDPPANIGSFLGGVSVAPNSGFTKVTFVINNGRYGHAESHVIATGIDNTAIRSYIGIVAGLRAKLLGNGQTGTGTYIKNSASPQIQFIRLTDAIFPRIGQVYDWTGKQYFGFPSVTTPNNAADFGSVSMTIRPQSQLAGNPVKNTSLQLVFNPDGLYANGEFDPTFASPGQESWVRQMSYFSAYLFTPSGTPWGIMSDDPTNPPLQCTNVLSVNGVFTFTFPGATWATGDRVRFARFGPVFNKTWTLVKVANEQYSLRKQPVSGHTLPPLGTAIRTQLANGVSTKVFTPYVGVQRTEALDIQVKVAKHNPGKEWLGVSFAHRVRRER